jgi:predicted anti-sigma-YlaC factor YlaD
MFNTVRMADGARDLRRASLMLDVETGSAENERARDQRHAYSQDQRFLLSRVHIVWPGFSQEQPTDSRYACIDLHQVEIGDAR